MPCTTLVSTDRGGSERLARGRACGGACPVAEDVADTALNLPNGPDTDVPRVIRALREAL